MQNPRPLSDIDLRAAFDRTADDGADRAALVDAAVRRGLLLPGLDVEWDTVRSETASRMSAFGVPDEVLASLRPCARLVQDPGGTSRLGGRPRLDAATPWPHRGGRPLDHVAQVDLAALPPAAHALGLPRRGLLTYFHDLEAIERGFGGWGYEWPADLGASFLVVVEADTAEPAEWPSGIPVERRLEGFPVSPRLVADVKSVYAEAVPARMPAHVSNGLREHLGSRGPDHKVLGVGVELQGPPLTIFPTLGRNDSPPPGATDVRAASADEWRLVLQLDTEVGDGLAWVWSDTGLLYVGVRHDDLVAGRLDRCWAVVVGT
jgi:hypothetical protein